MSGSRRPGPTQLRQEGPPHTGSSVAVVGWPPGLCTDAKPSGYPLSGSGGKGLFLLPASEGEPEPVSRPLLLPGGTDAPAPDSPRENACQPSRPAPSGRDAIPECAPTKGRGPSRLGCRAGPQANGTRPPEATGHSPTLSTPYGGLWGPRGRCLGLLVT